MTTANISEAIGISTQLTETDVEQLYDLARRYVEPSTALRTQERSAQPQRFYGPSNYRFGDWIGSTPEEDRPYTLPRGVMSPATRSDGYRETLIEEQTRRFGWVEADPNQTELPKESTADDFNLVPFKRVYPQASFARVPAVQVQVYKLTGQRAPKPRTRSIEVADTVDITRPATKWGRGDWQPLWGINLTDGSIYPVMSVLEPERQLTRFLDGLEKRELATWNFEDKHDELLQLDLLMHRGWGSGTSCGQPVDISAAFWADMAKRDSRRFDADEKAEAELQLLIDAANKLGLT
ncbi:MAG: hypothetical protein ACSLE3_06750 [Microbacteriaceae bacterium]